MTLDEFHKIALRDFSGFFTDWVEENKAEPDQWPMEMDEPEWWEQLIARLSVE